MFTCQTQRQRTSLQTVFVHPVWCLKCSLCPRWNCLAFQENPIWICRAELGASIESLNDVHTDPPFPVDLLAKFLGFLTGALPETNSDRLHLKNDAWNTFSLPFGALNFPIFRGKLAELVSGSKRMTWAPWSGHFSRKAAARLLRGHLGRMGTRLNVYQPWGKQPTAWSLLIGNNEMRTPVDLFLIPNWRD